LTVERLGTGSGVRNLRSDGTGFGTTTQIEQGPDGNLYSS